MRAFAEALFCTLNVPRETHHAVASEGFAVTGAAPLLKQLPLAHHCFPRVHRQRPV